MAELLSKQLIEENPILAAARANSSPVPASTAPVLDPPSSSSVSQSTSTSVTIKGTETAKNVEGITADSVVADITKGEEARTILQVQKNNQLEEQARRRVEVGDLIVKNALNVQIIKKVEDTAELKKQVDLHKILNQRGGGGAGAFVAESSRFAAAKKVASDNVVETQAAVEELVNDDTIAGFFKNLFFKGDLVEEANVAQATFNKLDNLQDQMNSFASGTDKALNNLKVTTTQATIAAEQNKIANVAVEASLLSKIEADKLRATQTQEAIDRSNSQTKMQIAKWQLLQQQKQFVANQEQRSALAKKAAEDDRVMETTIDAYLAGVKIVGGKTITSTNPTDIARERDEVKVRLGTKGKLQNDAIDLVTLGLGLAKPTPSQSYLGVAAYDTDSLINEVDPMKNLLTRTAAAVGLKAKEDGVKLTRELFEPMFNDGFKIAMEEAEEEIKPEDKENPNSAPPLSTLVESPALKDLPLVVNILSNLFNDKTKDLTPIQVMREGLAAIKTKSNPEGTITFEDYVNGLIAIYSKAADVNTTNQNREKLNLRPQTTYKIKLTDPNFFYNRFNKQSLTGDIIDIMDPTIVRAHALRALSSASLSKEQLQEIRSKASDGRLPEFLDFLDEDK